MDAWRSKLYVRANLGGRTASHMLGTAGYMVVAHVIIVSAPVQKIGFWGLSDLVWTLGSGSGACWDRGLGLGLGLYKKKKNIFRVMELSAKNLS